jgi:hypothetical protein
MLSSANQQDTAKSQQPQPKAVRHNVEGPARPCHCVPQWPCATTLTLSSCAPALPCLCLLRYSYRGGYRRGYGGGGYYGRKLAM